MDRNTLAVLARDVTEEQAMETTVPRKEHKKMDAMGQLTRWNRHDFNNLLRYHWQYQSAVRQPPRQRQNDRD